MLEALITWAIIILIILGVRKYLKRKKKLKKTVPLVKKNEISQERILEVEKNISQTTSEFKNNLLKVKKSFPFGYWHEELFKEAEMEQYTLENCKKAERIMNGLIDDLMQIGISSDENLKIEKFKKAVLELNILNNKNDRAIIETGEREDLCQIIDDIGEISGIVPEKYGDGDGIASEWREW